MTTHLGQNRATEAANEITCAMVTSAAKIEERDVKRILRKDRRLANRNKHIAGWMVLLSTIAVAAISVTYVYADYKYDRNIASQWSLADKSSTIEQKSYYIDRFVDALDGAGLNGTYDALWLLTPDVSFDSNMVALRSLQRRLHEIGGMDVSSFAYQSAIQQITAQEQGEAHRMLSVFRGCWLKSNYPICWGVYFGLVICGALIFVFATLVRCFLAWSR